MSESIDQVVGLEASGRRIVVRGTVQGVGFRPWVARLAREQGVAGEVWNAGDGVVIEAFAAAHVLDGLLARLAAPLPPAARVQTIDWQEIPLREGSGFTIARTAAGALRQVSIAPDLATCPRCASEIVDPQNRRFHYPFTNCTDCGPRFTIALDLPYDRATTTMAPFEMCPRCRREYADPRDRRYHAEPNACPVCGPRLRLIDVEGRELATVSGHRRELAAVSPLRAAARAIEAGLIVAVQGLGGFHLACDAGSALAVARLRQRKRRDEKPFAVMVRDLERAWRVAELSPAEEDLLLSVERPIVIARRTPGGGVCAEVAPENPWIGVLLPYTPLHHLLFAELDAALVMTSANPSGEPLAISPDEARARLSDVADLFLVHDRAIATRCDDSVVRWIAGGPVLLRRSRGYVPRAIRLARPVERPILGCGGQLKNTFCIALGDEAFLGPHVGDLKSLASCDAYGEAVERMERFLGVVPEVVAHDLHPGYFTTTYALARAGEHIGVQHHHAHVASALAEHGLAGPVLGLAWDGTGDGGDGTAWGGELLLADALGSKRLATLRPLALAGGEAAIHEPWRIALAALDDAFDGAPPLAKLALFDRAETRGASTVRQMIAAGVQSPRAHGIGRLFDAVGALVFAAPKARFEGQLAMRLEGIAIAAAAQPYPFTLERDPDPWQIDWRPLLRAVVEDLVRGVGAATIAGRFHDTLVAAAASAVRAASEERGPLPLVLTGGCFQNALLAGGVAGALADREVHLQRSVPPGDGGLALGQVWAANAVLSTLAGGA